MHGDWNPRGGLNVADVIFVVLTVLAFVILTLALRAGQRL
jgi:hypothetical protein